ncbi:MAG TPA: hypothetical protein GXX28_00065, partial [Firmicutes bacterium]|nr:hypothetical protein [Bacillota bacterium]
MENWRRHIAKAESLPAEGLAPEARLPYYRSDLRVTVRSVEPLSPEIVRAIAEKVRLAYQREVLIEVEIDPSLLGGLVVMVGHRVIDMSLATHLRRMSAQIAQRLEDVVKDLDAAWEKRLTESMEEFLGELRRQAEGPPVWLQEPAGNEMDQAGDQTAGPASEPGEVLAAAP